jgi:hypothetical protein
LNTRAASRANGSAMVGVFWVVAMVSRVTRSSYVEEYQKINLRRG